MKKTFCYAMFVSISISLFLTGYATAGEYWPTREGFKKEFKMHIKRGDETKEAKLEVAISPKTDLNGTEVQTETSIFTIENGGSVSAKNFFAENDQGVKIVASQTSLETSPNLRQEDTWLLKYPLAVGATWTKKEEVRPLKVKVSVPITCVIEKMDDVVTVPAGTFKNCMKIKQSYSGKINSDSSGDNPTVTVESYSWFAPGLGNIKNSYTVKCSNPEMGGGESQSEMVAYKN